MDRLSSLSRRQWSRSGLTTCGYLAASGLVLVQSDEIAALGYTPPGPVTERGRAPGLQARVFAENSGGEKTYALVLAKGEEVLAGLTEFAEREKITAGHFTALGALQSVRFGWFDAAHKAYRHIPINEQVELISFIGDVGVVNGAPQSPRVGLADGRMRGGHLLQAIVWPTLEVFFTAWPTTLMKKRDEETTLSLVALNA